MKKVILRILLAIVIVIAAVVLYLQLHGVFAKPYVLSSSDAAWNNEFLALNGVETSAHRMGAGLYPEDTMMSAKSLISDIKDGKFKIDVVEMDLWLTKDNELILMHDDTFDRTTNSEEVFGVTGAKPCDYTLEELSVLNFGENFETEDGQFPYRGLKGDEIPDDLKVLTLDQLLLYLTDNGDFKYILEIKDGGDRGIAAMDRLVASVKEFGLEEKVILASFNSEVLYHVDDTYPGLHRHASMGEVVTFFADFMLNKDPNKCGYKYDVIDIPARYALLLKSDEAAQKFGFCNLSSQGFINRAHEAGIAVYYWTINDEKLMRKLINKNADCIITDYPDRMP